MCWLFEIFISLIIVDLLNLQMRHEVNNSEHAPLVERLIIEQIQLKMDLLLIAAFQSSSVSIVIRLIFDLIG